MAHPRKDFERKGNWIPKEHNDDILTEKQSIPSTEFFEFEKPLANTELSSGKHFLLFTSVVFHH